jgi:hydrogenase maturation protease
MSPRILVAGVGNIFLGDDGFGVEVVRRMLAEPPPGGLGPLPEGVEVADFGIRGVHLAYQLLDGYDAAVIVDALPGGGEPGTLYVVEPTAGAKPSTEVALMDAHGMEPHAVLALLDTLGGSVGKVLVVGCEPASVDEAIGLSPAVEGAIPGAIGLVHEVVGEIAASASSLAGAGHEDGRRE